MYSHLISLIVPVNLMQNNTIHQNTLMYMPPRQFFTSTHCLYQAQKTKKSYQYYLRYKMWCVFTLQLGRLGCSHAWFSDDSYFWEGSVLTWNRDIWPWLLFSPWGHKNCDVPVASLKEVVNCQLNSATWKNFLVSMT